MRDGPSVRHPPAHRGALSPVRPEANATLSRSAAISNNLTDSLSSESRRPSAPLYLDDKMHDLKLERFLNEAPRGPIKTFTLRGIKDSPPYLHDGRALTLEDTVEFFSLVLSLQLSKQEKADLVAFMRQL